MAFIYLVLGGSPVLATLVIPHTPTLTLSRLVPHAATTGFAVGAIDYTLTQIPNEILVGALPAITIHALTTALIAVTGLTLTRVLSNKFT